jgi:hypothetical protein
MKNLVRLPTSTILFKAVSFRIRMNSIWFIGDDYWPNIEGPYMDSPSFANNPTSGREVRLLTYIRSRTAASASDAGP